MSKAEELGRWADREVSSRADRIAAWARKLGADALSEAGNNLNPSGSEKLKQLLQEELRGSVGGETAHEFIEEFLYPESGAKKLIADVLYFLSGIVAIIMGNHVLAREINYIYDSRDRSFRLDPMSVITAWRRDPEKYEPYFTDLRVQGWSEDRIEALKFFTLFYPPPADLIRWQAREVFEPDMIAKYGLDDELEGIEKEPFYKAGMDDEQIRNYWRAHWEHASWIQVVEMLRRGLLTEDDVWEWFRVVEIPPFWRDKLIGISWEVPTRVDVRRFWEYGTIDESRLREIYSAQGYHGKDLDDYVLWTKVYTAFPDLLARWKNGWITLDDLRDELIRSGMTADKADELIQTKVKAVEPTSTAEGKELTKSEIYKGVKKEAITFDQGVELLMDLDYTYDQAVYLLAINTEVLAGSPESFADFKKLTGMYRKTAETKGEAMPEELQNMAARVVDLTGDLDNIRKQLDIKEADIVDEEALPAEARDELNALRTTLLRTGAELERVKAEYQRQLSIWRQRPEE